MPVRCLNVFTWLLKSCCICRRCLNALLKCSKHLYAWCQASCSYSCIIFLFISGSSQQSLWPFCLRASILAQVLCMCVAASRQDAVGGLDLAGRIARIYPLIACTFCLIVVSYFYLDLVPASGHRSYFAFGEVVNTGLATWAWCWLRAPWPPVLAASQAATDSSIRIYSCIYIWMYP